MKKTSVRNALVAELARAAEQILTASPEDDFDGWVKANKELMDAVLAYKSQQVSFCFAHKEIGYGDASGGTCLLRKGHKGRHQYTDDDEILLIKSGESAAPIH